MICAIASGAAAPVRAAEPISELWFSVFFAAAIAAQLAAVAAASASGNAFAKLFAVNYPLLLFQTMYVVEQVVFSDMQLAVAVCTSAGISISYAFSSLVSRLRQRKGAGFSLLKKKKKAAY